MKKLLISLCMLFLTTPVFAEVIEIYSPGNYQTVFNKEGKVKISFRINAATLHMLPDQIKLYVNGIEQKSIKYGSSTYFLINGVPDGTYFYKIAVFGIDKRPLHVTGDRRFIMQTKPFNTKPTVTGGKNETS